MPTRRRDERAPEQPGDAGPSGGRRHGGRWADQFGDECFGQMEDSASRRGTPSLAEFEDVSRLVVTERPTVTFDDVIGCARAKEAMREAALALVDPSRYLPFGGQELIPRGILLYGPPGVGKTMLAKALAHETKRPFVSVQTNDIVCKWFGESEKNLNRVFEYARALADAPTADGGPGSGTVVFFDEIDALGADRDATPFAGGVTQRIVSVFLAETSGVRSDGSGHVLMVAATNRIDAMDSALKRPGRFDMKIEIGLPGPEDRLLVFDSYFQHFETAAQREFIDVDREELKSLVEKSDGMSPAEIREVVRRALQREASLYRSTEGTEPQRVGPSVFFEAIDEVSDERSGTRPSIGFAGR